MTDVQILTLAIAIIIPITAVIYSNTRITDVGKRFDEAKETLRAEIKAETATLRGAMATLRGAMAELRAHLDSGFERLEHALKLHELEHHK